MKINTSDHEVRKFGLMFAAICAGVALFSAYRGGHAWPWFSGGGAFFLLSGLFARPVLRPIYAGWMKFAFALGWVNTRVILGVFFYVILTPLGVILRLTGWDPLTRKIDRAAPTYWIHRAPEPFDPKKYERLF